MLMMLAALGKKKGRLRGKRHAADAHDAGSFRETALQLMLMMLAALGKNGAAAG